MSHSAFLDTNILVYAHDQHENRKQKKAQKSICNGIEKENLLLSVQVLGEFFNAVTRQTPRPLPPDEAQEVIGTIGIVPV